MWIPGGTPFEPVIGKEGFANKAVDTATPPTAAATGAFSIKKLNISLRASMLSLVVVVVCSCLQIGLKIRGPLAEKMLKYVNVRSFFGTSYTVLLYY